MRRPVHRAVLVALVLCPLVAAPVAAASSPTLTAQAPSPVAGAPPLQVSYRLYDYVDRSLVRVESRPAPDTIVLRTYAYRLVWIGGGEYQEVPTRACGRMRVRATLYPGPGNPRELVRALLPRADSVFYSASTDTVDPLGATVGPPHVVAARGRKLHRWRNGATAARALLTDWHQGDQDGFAALTAIGTVGRAAAACRADHFRPLPFTAPEDD